MHERRGFVLHAPIGRAIWSLSWPIILSNEVSNLTVGVLLFWLGRLVGQNGLVVDSMFRPAGTLVVWTFAGISAGASVLVSRSVGAADGRGLSIAAGAVTLTLYMWALVAVVVLPISPWLAGVLAGHLHVDQSMLHYMLGWFLVALPGMTVMESLLEVANATGDTRFNLVRILVDLVFMAALTPLLIDVAGMGIAGGPASLGLSAGGLFVFMWFALVRRRAKLGLGELGTGAWRIRWGLWKEMLGIGLPPQIGRIAIFGAQLVLIRLVMHDGTASVAGYGIAGALVFFGIMATLGLAQGSAILVGQSLGAGLHERARRGLRTTLIAGWMVIAVFIVVTMFDRPIIGLFTSDQATAKAAGHALSILRWGAVGGGTWQILLANFAAHRTTVRATMLMLVGEGFGLGIAFLWPGSHLDGVCFAFVAANGLKAAFLLWLLATGTMARARASEAAASPELDR